MSNIFVGLKKTCLGVSDRVERDKDNETCLKEGGEIEMSSTVLPLRDARSLRLNTYHCLVTSDQILSTVSTCPNLYCQSFKNQKATQKQCSRKLQ